MSSVLPRVCSSGATTSAVARALEAAATQHPLNPLGHTHSFHSMAGRHSLTGLISGPSSSAQAGTPTALFHSLLTRLKAGSSNASGSAALSSPSASTSSTAAPLRHLTSGTAAKAHACSTSSSASGLSGSLSRACKGSFSTAANSAASTEACSAGSNGLRLSSSSSSSSSSNNPAAALWRRFATSSVNQGGGEAASSSGASARGAAAGVVSRGGRSAGAAFSLPPALTSSEALAAGVPQNLRRQLVWWMGGTAAWVYTMVVLGGITRLTRSGLSMTDWKFTGERPPLTDEHWAEEFGKYQQSPEFKKLHPNMTLEDFKFIFWMEYAHRMWGRLLGVAFVLPAAYFAARGAINKALAKRLGLLFTMGGTQGLVGWWMVRSGLDEPQDEWQAPRVSPYRLAAHLVSAFTIYATLAWTAMDLSSPTPAVRNMGQAATTATRLVRRVSLPFAALVAVTATSGAFVAGMDAGRAFNTFPLMGGQWIPEEYWDLWDRGYGFRNFFENTAAVQFDHRVLAGLTACAVGALWSFVRLSPKAASVPHRAKLAMDLVAAITIAQATLGVWTLLEIVPPHLGSAHQANALNLFTAVLWTLHALRPSMPGPRAAQLARFVTPAAVTGVLGIGLGVTANI